MAAYGSSNQQTNGAGSVLTAGDDGIAAVGRQIERLTEAAGVVKFPKVPELLRPDDEHGLRYAIVKHDGSIEWVTVAAPPRRNAADTVQDLADLIVKLRPENEYKPDERAEAYVRAKVYCEKPRGGDTRPPEQRMLEDAHARLFIECVLEPADVQRADRVLLSYDVGGTLRALEWLRVQRPLIDQRSLVNLLRSDLNMGGTAFLAAIRAIKVRTGEEVESKVEHQGDQLGVRGGSALESENGPIPEDIEIKFEAVPGSVLGGPEDAGIECVVECTVQVLAKTGQFRIIPKPGEVESATRRVGTAIARALQVRANDYGGKANRLSVFLGDAPVGVGAK